MPPHPEVPAALKKLRAAGFRLCTLTDNLLEVQGRQLEDGEIFDLFYRRFSVERIPEVRRHKPAPKLTHMSKGNWELRRRSFS